MGAIYFAGYAVAVPFLARATDRTDGRLIVAGSSLLGAAAGFAFFVLADGFWSALAIRFVGGGALAGVHMPGLKLLAERTEGPGPGTRCRPLYVELCDRQRGILPDRQAALIELFFGWQAVFLAGAIGPLLAVAAIAGLGPATSLQPVPASAPTFADVARNRPFMAYVLGFAGNTWEVFRNRSLVCRLPVLDARSSRQRESICPTSPCSQASPRWRASSRRSSSPNWQRDGRAGAHHRRHVPPVRRGVPGTGSHFRRRRLRCSCASRAAADHELCRRVGALGAGAVALADPSSRGTSLALYALAGFVSGFLGPAVGCVLGLVRRAGQRTGMDSGLPDHGGGIGRRRCRCLDDTPRRAAGLTARRRYRAFVIGSPARSAAILRQERRSRRCRFYPSQSSRH